MDISCKRVRKDGREGNIFNIVEVGVHWDNGGMNKERLEDLEFIEEIPVKLPKVDPNLILYDLTK